MYKTPSKSSSHETSTNTILKSQTHGSSSPSYSYPSGVRTAPTSKLLNPRGAYPSGATTTTKTKTATARASRRRCRRGRRRAAPGRGARSWTAWAGS
uniref:Uncharacterized protein n=1 Tax=Triticum urartu TaxID=4572 RepID=A0A8R7UYY5_TRIUA